MAGVGLSSRKENQATLILLSFIFPGFMGYASEMHSLVSHHEVKDIDDDQLYYTKLYLDKEIRVSNQ